MNLSPSTSTSPDSTLSCRICDFPAHGIHFGVLTCRACAAFFRRSVVTKRHLNYLCRSGNEQCVVSSKSRYSCKLCRFKKCEHLGMTADNVQLNRDSFKKGEKKENSKKKQIRPFKRVSESMLISFPKTIMDVTTLSKEIQKNMEHVPIYWSMSKYKELNLLQKMEYALIEWRRGQKPAHKLKQLTRISARELFVFFENYMVELSRWLSHFPYFQKLSTIDKYRFVKCVWNIFRKFERTDMSVRLFGHRTADENMIAFTHDLTVHTTNFHVDYSEISDRPNKEISNMIESTVMPIYSTVARPMIEIRPSLIEISYMLSQLCWQIAGKNLQGNVLEISEIVKDELADNLHSYYVNDMKQPNYAGRLVRLMKIVNSAKKVQIDFQNMLELARLFDVFKIDFSEPDIITG